MFVLVVVGLDRVLSYDGNSGLIGGLLASQVTSLINLQYTDDTLVFGQNNIKQAIVLRWISRCFEAWSGFKINFYKSSLVRLGERSFLSSLIISIFECKEEEFPLKYFGIPLSPNKLKRADWSPLLESFKRKLRGWEGNLLSLEERLTLLNVMLSATPMYYMTYLSSPNGCET